MCRCWSTKSIDALALHGGETVVDGTFGAGGYTRAMLAAGAGRVIGFDRDPDAIEAGRSLVPDPRLTLVEERFSQMDRVLAERGIGLVDAIALDIGVSSMQLDRAERGFSFQADGPLDMRMSKSGLTAAEYPEFGRRGRDRPGPARLWGGAARPGDRPRHRCRTSGRAHRRACRDRPPRRRFPPGPEERSGDPHVPGDPHPSQRRARRARAGAGGGRTCAAPRRTLGRRHLSQPRGPDREALLPRTQRRNAGRFAPPSRACRPERTDVRAGRQAGFPDGARAGREPSRPLGAPAERGPHLCSSTEGNAAMSARKLPLAVHGRQLRRSGARLLSRLAPRRVGARRSSRMSRRRSCSPSATCACSRPRSERAAGCRSSSAGTPVLRAVGAGCRPVPRAAASSSRGLPSRSSRSISRRRWCLPRRPRLKPKKRRSASRRRTMQVRLRRRLRAHCFTKQV